MTAQHVVTYSRKSKKSRNDTSVLHVPSVEDRHERSSALVSEGWSMAALGKETMVQEISHDR